MKKTSTPKQFAEKFAKAKRADAVGRKVSKLVDEGKPHKQAVAIALDMERRGELSKGKKKSKKKKFRIKTKTAVMGVRG